MQILHVELSSFTSPLGPHPPLSAECRRKHCVSEMCSELSGTFYFATGNARMPQMPTVPIPDVCQMPICKVTHLVHVIHVHIVHAHAGVVRLALGYA